MTMHDEWWKERAPKGFVDRGDYDKDMPFFEPLIRSRIGSVEENGARRWIRVYDDDRRSLL